MKEKKINKEKQEWMKMLKNKDKRLNEYILPGSHNSGAYFIDKSIKFNHSLSIVRKIPYLKKQIIKWTKCQEMNIMAQLNNGIRIFDIRVTYLKKFYTSNVFMCQDLEEVLLQFEKFTSEHPTEIIILYIHPDKTHFLNSYLLNDLIKKHLGKFIYNGEIPTYNQMIKLNKTIFILDDINLGCNNCHNIEEFNSKLEVWLNTDFNTDNFNAIVYTLVPNFTLMKKAEDIQEIAYIMGLNFRNVKIKHTVFFDFINKKIIQSIIDSNF